MFLDLTKSQIKNVVKRHNNRFTPKYRAFSILQNKIEEVVRKSTKLWKIIYKKIDDVFDEDYKVEASVKTKVTKEERRKKLQEKKVEEEKKDEEEKEEAISKEEEKKRGQMSNKNRMCKTQNYHLQALLILPSHLQRQSR